MIDHAPACQVHHYNINVGHRPEGDESNSRTVPPSFGFAEHQARFCQLRSRTSQFSTGAWVDGEKARIAPSLTIAAPGGSIVEARSNVNLIRHAAFEADGVHPILSCGAGLHDFSRLASNPEPELVAVGIHQLQLAFLRRTVRRACTSTLPPHRRGSVRSSDLRIARPVEQPGARALRSGIVDAELQAAPRSAVAATSACLRRCRALSWSWLPLQPLTRK